MISNKMSRQMAALNDINVHINVNIHKNINTRHTETVTILRNSLALIIDY